MTPTTRYNASDDKQSHETFFSRTMQRGAMLAFGQAVCDSVGFYAAKVTLAYNVCVSKHFPSWVKDASNAYGTLTAKARHILFNTLAFGMQKNEVMQQLLSVGCLAPLIEETERAAVIFAVKKCFANPHSKSAKTTAILLSTLIFALSHFHYAIPREVRQSWIYQSSPQSHANVTILFRPWQVVNDAQIVASLLSGLFYGYAYESSGSILAPIVLHAGSNIGLYALGLHRIAPPENIQQMMRENIAPVQKLLKMLQLHNK